ncbi:MAG: hypothetical protein COA62_11905 [Rhodobiaceae bacterium]|nr:MAG: hypothetical protein COA62_11905 [Rhodobiaceae bacterium]
MDAEQNRESADHFVQLTAKPDSYFLVRKPATHQEEHQKKTHSNIHFLFKKPVFHLNHRTERPRATIKLLAVFHRL